MDEEKGSIASPTVGDRAIGDVSDVSGGSLWNRIKGHAELEVQPSAYAPPGTNWSNVDLDPVPLEYQNWRTYDFVTYWISDAFSLSNWRIGASLIAIGLSWKLSLVAIVIGNFVTALVVTYNGMICARLHVPFTIQARSAFGFYFSYAMVIVRVVVSLFWYGIGTYNGGECVQGIIYAWAPGFRNIPNHLPASANIDTGFMISYFIYFVLVLPFHYIPAHQLKWVFALKSVTTPIAGFALLGWMVQAVRSAGRQDDLFAFGNAYSGSQLGWAFMAGINAMIGNFATLGVNMGDFSRYARRPQSLYIQLFVIPVVFLVMMLFGVIGANASRVLYGELLWDPVQIANHWTSPGGRAAAFFVALAFLVANITINLSANSIAVAVDLTTLFPRYLNLRRAQYVCAVLGAWALTPWNILASAETLLNFMDGYTIFLAPISAILISDYWVVHRQRVSIVNMYTPHGIYAYEKWGTNWRALLAYFIGFVPLLPGLASATSSSSSIHVSAGAGHIYSIGYFYGFFTTSAVYIGLSMLFPPKSGSPRKTIDEQIEQTTSGDY